MIMLSKFKYKINLITDVFVSKTNYKFIHEILKSFRTNYIWDQKR